MSSEDIVTKAYVALDWYPNAPYFLFRMEFTEYIESVYPGSRHSMPNIKYTTFKTEGARIRRDDLVSIARAAEFFGLFCTYEFDPVSYRYSKRCTAPFLEPDIFNAWCDAVTED